MNVRSTILALAGAALALLLIKSFQSQPERSAPSPAPDPGPVASMVEETLHQHEGEQSPCVAAFEEALHPGEPHGAKPA
jgi:hypothetical protein